MATTAPCAPPPPEHRDHRTMRAAAGKLSTTSASASPTLAYLDPMHGAAPVGLLHAGHLKPERCADARPRGHRSATWRRRRKEEGKRGWSGCCPARAARSAAGGERGVEQEREDRRRGSALLPWTPSCPCSLRAPVRGHPRWGRGHSRGAHRRGVQASEVHQTRCPDARRRGHGWLAWTRSGWSPWRHDGGAPGVRLRPAASWERDVRYLGFAAFRPATCFVSR